MIKITHHRAPQNNRPRARDTSLRLRRGCSSLFCYLAITLSALVSLILPPNIARAAEALTYDITITGLETGDLAQVKESFTSSSLLETQRDEPLYSVANLQKKLGDDIRLMTRILRAEGYYDSAVNEGLTRQKNHFTIKLRVIPGPLYHIGKISFDYRSPPPEADIRRQIEQGLSLKAGDPARALAVIKAEAELTERLPRLGFPFAAEIVSDILVDHDRRTMDISYALETGNRRRMGSFKVTGLTSVDESTVSKFITWRSRDYYDQRRLTELQSRLNKSGLFTGIKIDVLPKNDDLADVTIKLSEAKHRTLGAATGYSTSEGLSAEVSWEHQNFLHQGNRLKLVGRVAEIEQSISSQLEIPHFKRLDQTLSFEVGYRRQDTDAFFTHTITSNAGLNRVINEYLAVRAGVDLEYSDITDHDGVNRNFYIASLPLGVRWDTSDSLLDPTRGWRLSFVTAPSIGVDGDRFTFLKNELRASAYYPVIKDSTVIALRSRVGAIRGPNSRVLPATRRFYAGGGGSVRGYGYQRVGPLDMDGAPIGGRSVVELAAELRWKIMTDISIVPFIDGGNVYEASTPKFSGLRWGAGIGARYHTDFGPVRIDVAFPLNRREDDGSFQLYISLGQAF